MIDDPASELLEHVDDEDRAIGPIPRGRAHKEGLRHRAVHVVVHNCHGRILLQRRAAGKDYPGMWDTSVGGHVGAGESYQEAALRECKEEIGIHVRAMDLGPVGKHLFDELPTDVEWVETFELEHEGPFHPDPKEVEQVRWFTADEIEALVAQGATTPHFALQWRRELASMARDLP